MAFSYRLRALSFHLRPPGLALSAALAAGSAAALSLQRVDLDQSTI